MYGRAGSCGCWWQEEQRYAGADTSGIQIEHDQTNRCPKSVLANNPLALWSLPRRCDHQRKDKASVDEIARAFVGGLDISDFAKVTVL